MPVDTHEDIMPAAGIEGPNVVETHEDIQPAMGMTAYHGSPHEFEQFDTSKIGTGVGATAFGHGLYFAEREPVAREYLGAGDKRYARLSGHLGPKEESAFDIASNMDKPTDWDIMKKLVEKYGNNIDFDEAQELAKNALLSRGHMYEVLLNVKPEHLLDWDKPIKDQHPDVQESIKNLPSYSVSDSPDATGGLLYRSLGGLDNAKEASANLAGIGLRGIRYKDYKSNSHNYVIFDPQHIKIKRRYAEGGGVKAYFMHAPQDLLDRAQRAYGGAIAGPKLTEENAEDFARRLILWSYAAAPFVNRSIRRATGGEVDPSVDQALDTARGASQADPAASAMETARSLTPMGFYSAAAEAASKIPQRAPVDQILNKVKGSPGVKAEELDWSGVKDAFAGQRSVDPQEVARHFQANLPALQETVKYDPLDIARKLSDQRAALMFQGRRGSEEDEALKDKITQTYNPSWRRENAAVYGQYTLPDGANYREVLLHLPKYEPENMNEVNDKRRDIYKKTADAAEEWKRISEESGPGHTDALAAYKRFAELRKEKENFEKQFKNLTTDIDSKNYKSSHWNVPNVVAHLRLSDRDMGKTLHMEELQSDWGQEGRDQGFGGRDTTGWRAEPTGEPGGGMYVFDQNNRQIGYAPVTHSETERDAINHVASFIKGPPKGPHVTSNEGWTDLGLKRALQEAAKGGYKELIWTPGQEQADRYDLSNQVKHIMWSPDNKILSALTHDNSEAIGQRVEKEDLHKYIGKEAAKKLLEQEPEMDGNMATHHLRGQAISVGGEGMKNYYDRFLPGRLQKLISKLDPEAKVQLYGHRMFVPDEREGDSEEGEYKNVHSLKITPKLRAAILKGLPAYKQGGFATNSAPIVNKALDVVSGLRR